MIHELNYYFNQKVHFNNFTQKIWITYIIICNYGFSVIK